jgi:hypothetical protein
VEDKTGFEAMPGACRRYKRRGEGGWIVGWVVAQGFQLVGSLQPAVMLNVKLKGGHPVLSAASDTNRSFKSERQHVKWVTY